MVLRKRILACLLVLAMCVTCITPCASATGGYDEDGWSDVGHSHNYSGQQVRVEPDCVNDGYVGVRCIGCDTVRRDQILPALGHNYANGVCLRCGSRQPNFCPGDLNGDNIATNEDVVILLWCVLFPGMFPLDGDVDFTGDGKLNNDDVIALLWYVLFPDEFPLMV